ncbi:hypothetical protein [Prochlorococcus sp. MIT 0801]|uniref:hypothetical protein n=1 Tax=Prochlorococcus sp. MIT 0801 TaxID=1501269 RepID=UPI0004F77904|nr:hypothetical protein [Prochlorococcus sp. MIT 0801]AIQ97017.1 hypothetical protein EW15_0925 [Prochlorococcus sp. MIT 0801]
MKWEYQVIHLNVDDSSSKSEEASNPEAASEKLKGSLSPDFLKDQFPDQYQENEGSEHPAIQLSKFLNKKGLDRWEFSETIEIGEMLFLIMKRQVD